MLRSGLIKKLREICNDKVLFNNIVIQVIEKI